MGENIEASSHRIHDYTASFFNTSSVKINVLILEYWLYFFNIQIKKYSGKDNCKNFFKVGIRFEVKKGLLPKSESAYGNWKSIYYMLMDHNKIAC